jgi:hypothetical protein
MDELERIVGGLRPSEKTAIEVLEKHGWAIMYDCKIEDGRNPDGSRRRTFMRAARHDLVLMLKKADGRELPVEDTNPEVPVGKIQDEQPIIQPRPIPWINEPQKMGKGKRRK